MVWLLFVFGSRADLRCMRITQHAQHLQYVEPQEDHIFRVIISVTFQPRLQVCLFIST